MPVLLFEWNEEIVDLFIEKSNAADDPKAPQPDWIKNGPVTSQTLMGNIALHLDLAGGGDGLNNDSGYVAISSLNQFCNALRQLDRIETNPFMQEIMLKLMRDCIPDESNVVSARNIYLAKIRIMESASKIHKFPSLPMPSGFINLFL